MPRGRGVTQFWISFRVDARGLDMGCGASTGPSEATKAAVRDFTPVTAGAIAAEAGAAEAGAGEVAASLASPPPPVSIEQQLRALEADEEFTSGALRRKTVADQRRSERRTARRLEARRKIRSSSLLRQLAAFMLAMNSGCCILRHHTLLCYVDIIITGIIKICEYSGFRLPSSCVE